MVARSGVRRSGPLVGAGTCAAALVFVVAGCSGDALLVGEERPPAGPGTDGEEGPDRVNPAQAPIDVALVSDCPPSPEERQALLGCWPPRHLGSWRGFFIGVPRYETLDGAGAEFPAGDVLLELGIDGSAHLTFGAPRAGSVGRDSPTPLCAPREEAPGCPTLGRVIDGFAYSLAELELFDPKPGPDPSIRGEPRFQLAESMAFVVQVSEPWDVWCAAQGAVREWRCAGEDCPAGEWLPGERAAIDAQAAAADERSGCRCGEDGCRADAPSPSLSIELQMSDDQKALRGRYRPNDASIGEAGLELRKEP